MTDDGGGGPRQGGEDSRRRTPLIVGIGGSAGAMDSIERFFSRLVLEPDQAVVLVMQHREAVDESELRRILQAQNGRVLSEAQDGALIEGGKIYLCPTNMITSIQSDRFAIRNAEQASGERATIDSFLVSLAEAWAERSIGVMLAGTGGDGTLGVATLKEYGGLAIAERTASESRDSLPDSNTPAAIADFVLAPDDIPRHIQVYARHLRRLDEKQGFDEVLAAAATSLGRIADILRSRTGNDFHGYKQNTFLRRVQRRMQVVQIDDMSAYIDFLRNDKDEVQLLYKDLLIGVTEFPISTAAGRAKVELPPARTIGSDVGLERRAQRIAERYAPAYVITDENFQILHFSGRTGRYIEPTSGTATLDLLGLVHRDLRLDLRSAFSRALETNEAASAEQVQLGLNGHRVPVDITVEPIPDGTGEHRHFVVLFKDGPIRVVDGRDDNANGLIPTKHVERLEGELRITRERLQATIEELESTNEELKSSSVEYQSLNEELQSANEELETSREELQSVNEELTTVNGELAHRVQELTRATSDLNNFLESTQVATVFLDNDLRVMNFTPAITQVLHLVETDVGRPIAHIKARIPIEELYDEVRWVLRNLASAERELTAPESGSRYIVRMLPYRSIDNFIAGVVITFIDVTAIVRAEERQRLLLTELQHRVRNTLGVIRSIVRRSAENSSTVEDYAAHLDGRLNAFARTQSLVVRDPESGVDLEYLVVEELHAYNAREGERVDVSGPTVRLQPKAAETIALAIHELATNAIKYGALSEPAGRIEIMWRIESADSVELVFEWRENGGPSVAPPQRKGFGTELLERTLAFELNGRTTLTFSPSGVHCRIVVPLNRRVVHTPAMDE
jgi:two-component sensor histidine kinase